MIVAVAAIIVIKQKINTIHERIEAKLATVNEVIHVGEAIVDKAKGAFSRKK